VIVVTGGAGFIGSVLVWRLNEIGVNDIIVVDHLGESEKWKNLVSLKFSDYLDKSAFISKLENGEFGHGIDAIFHLGACSSTTESNADYLMENNYRYSLRIGQWWEAHQSTRLMYASSAATYGDGSQGYCDDESKLETLRPLNMYGYSKHLFDCAARKNKWLSQIVGLKFFNVFGPNENHKADMRSVINKAYPGVKNESKMTLFQSHREGYGHGEQRRDFIYVKDAVEMMLYFFHNRNVSGLYNIGTGIARSWNDVASAMFAALGKTKQIDYRPMPESIREKYQYFTQADLTKLRAAGCGHACRSLEVSIAEYMNDYLSIGGVIMEPAKAGGR